MDIGHVLRKKKTIDFEVNRRQEDQKLQVKIMAITNDISDGNEENSDTHTK